MKRCHFLIFDFFGLIIQMDSQPLVSSQKIQTRTQPRLTQLSIIPRYNIFIRCYNEPNCLVNSTTLQPMPTNLIHDTVFMALTDWKAKVILFIFLFAPIINGIMCLISLYCLYVYCQCLSIHNQNSSTIQDPFKNMVYDHDLCFKLRKDYYSFSIEFKELQGFSLNYNKDMRKQLTLRQQRGKVNFLIYNGNFWASYHHFSKWKQLHLIIVGLSLILSVAINILFFLLLF